MAHLLGQKIFERRLPHVERIDIFFNFKFIRLDSAICDLIQSVLSHRTEVEPEIRVAKEISPRLGSVYRLDHRLRIARYFYKSSRIEVSR